MSRWRCKACKGEYDDRSAAGTLYFHACPPLVDPATGETKPRPKHRDERPQDVSVEATKQGFVVVDSSGKSLSSSATMPAAPARAEGAGREQIK